MKIEQKTVFKIADISLGLGIVVGSAMVTGLHILFDILQFVYGQNSLIVPFFIIVATWIVTNEGISWALAINQSMAKDALAQVSE